MKVVTKLTIKLANKFMARNDKPRLASMKLDDNIRTIRNISYMNDDKREHLFDIHFPNAENDKHQTLIDIHGGAYIYGYKENNIFYCQDLAKRGYKVISLNYSLSNGKTSVITVIKELATALNFLIENKDEFGIDLDELFLMGDSAGGHLAILLALAVNIDEVKETLGVKFIKDIKIKKVITASPLYDYYASCMDMKKRATKGGLKYFVGKDAFDDNYPIIACPKKWINKLEDINFEIFVSTCDDDFLKHHSLMLKEDLKDKVILFYPKTETKLDHIFPIIKSLTDEAKMCLDEIEKFTK